jgi:DNA-binding MarR family transcriptional regulator
VLTRSITRLFERWLRPDGIHATQLTTLAVLSMRGPVSISRLARDIGVERTTLSRNLARLEAEGWAKVISGAEDTAPPAWRDAQRAALSTIGRAGADALRRLAAESIG